MPRKKKSAQAPRPEPEEDDMPPSNLKEIGDHIHQKAKVPPAVVDEILHFIDSQYDVVSTDRTEQIANDLSHYIFGTKEEPGHFECTTTEMLMALLHLQVKIFDVLRQRKAAVKIVEKLMQKPSPSPKTVRVSGEEDDKPYVADYSSLNGSSEFYA